MKRKVLLNSFVAIAATLAITSTASAANLITNGDFESQIATGSYQTFNAPNSFTGWTVINSVDLIHNYWVGNPGQSVDLNGLLPANMSGGLSQTIATVVGQQYKVSFDLAGNPDDSDTIKNLLVTLGVNPDHSYTFDTAGFTKSNMGWLNKEFTFTADSASTLITFASQNTGSWGPALDNVKIEAAPAPAPEPASMVLGLMSLGSMLGFRRKKA